MNKNSEIIEVLAEKWVLATKDIKKERESSIKQSEIFKKSFKNAEEENQMIRDILKEVARQLKLSFISLGFNKHEFEKTISEIGQFIFEDYKTRISIIRSINNNQPWYGISLNNYYDSEFNTTTFDFVLDYLEKRIPQILSFNI